MMCLTARAQRFLLKIVNTNAKFAKLYRKKLCELCVPDSYRDCVFAVKKNGSVTTKSRF